MVDETTPDSPHAIGTKNAGLLHPQPTPNCLPVLDLRMRWNCRTLLHACEELLQRADCSLHLAAIRENSVTAKNEFTWSDGKASQIKLVVDPAQASLVEGFLHEALHVVLAEQMEAFNAVLEEATVRAIEQHLWTKTMRREDTSRWRRIINAKLK